MTVTAYKNPDTKKKLEQQIRNKCFNSFRSAHEESMKGKALKAVTRSRNPSQSVSRRTQNSPQEPEEDLPRAEDSDTVEALDPGRRLLGGGVGAANWPPSSSVGEHTLTVRREHSQYTAVFFDGDSVKLFFFKGGFLF